MGFQSAGAVVFVVIEVLLVAGALALAFSVAKSSERRARSRVLAVALAVASVAFFAVLHLALVNFVMPAGWIVGVAVTGVALVALVFLVARDAGWRFTNLMAIAGIVLLGAIVYYLPNMFGGGRYLQPLYEQRASQIAEVNGFTAFLPANERMKIDYGWFVEEVDGGLGVGYEGFDVRESKGTGASAEQLRGIVGPGQAPMGDELEEERVPASGGEITTTTVQGAPAIGIEYQPTLSGEAAKGGKVPVMAVLVFELDGTQVRMSSNAGTEMPGGEYDQSDSYSHDVKQLVEIAETMRVVE